MKKTYTSKNNLDYTLKYLKNKLYNKEETDQLIEDNTTKEINKSDIDEMFENFQLENNPHESIITENGIKTTRQDTIKSGFILTNDKDLNEIFPKINDINFNMTGSGNVVSTLSINTSNNKLTINTNKINIINSHCSYCSYCTYCNCACGNCPCVSHCTCCSG